MEQYTEPSEGAVKEKPRKRFTYHDNSLPDRPVVFETFAEGILQADGKFMKEKGVDPARESNIGCVVEDLLEIGKKDFEKFQNEYLAREGITLAEYGKRAEEETYRAYCEDLGLTESMLVGKKILDIGSAKSFFASYCLKQGISDTVYSVDGGESSYTDQEVKKAIWSEAVKNGVEGRTKKALMQALPYEDGSFDVVVILAALPGRDKEFRGELTLEQDIDRSYDEILRVLAASGGEARIASFSGDEDDEYFGEWYKATKKKLEELSQKEGIEVIFEDIPEQEGQRIIIRKNAEVPLN
jgi:2-polyprenyl-3-methyl-5-hydroxy-6-metoxy-1,4-benzoquinol methylase